MDNSERTFDGFTNLGNYQNQYELNSPKATMRKTQQGENVANTLGSTLELAGSGATIGTALGGPFGTGVGAGIGALVGLGKGIWDSFNTDSKEADQSKAMEKYNAKLDEEKFAQLNIRRIGNDIRTSQAMNTINTKNLQDYTNSPTNQYA